MIFSKSERCRRVLPAIAMASVLVTPFAAQSQGTLRVGMTASDIPLTTGQTDQGGEGMRFIGYTLYDALINWDLTSADRPSALIPGLATEWSVDEEDTDAVIDFLSDQTFQNYEGCLSVPNLRGVVTRHLEIRVRGLDRGGQAQSFAVRGYSAGTFQHEYDHLDGLLFPHRVTDPSTFCSWSSFAAFRQDAFAREVGELVQRWGA